MHGRMVAAASGTQRRWEADDSSVTGQQELQKRARLSDDEQSPVDDESHERQEENEEEELVQRGDRPDDTLPERFGDAGWPAGPEPDGTIGAGRPSELGRGVLSNGIGGPHGDDIAPKPVRDVRPTVPLGQITRVPGVPAASSA